MASGAHSIPACRRLAAALPTVVADADIEGLPQSRPARRRAACSSSALRRPGCSLPTRSQRSGRHVTLAVGEHIRMPRMYRGLDIQWWLDAIGVLDERYRRSRRHRQGAARAIAAAGRHAAALDARPEHARRARRRDRRPSRRLHGSNAQFSGSFAIIARWRISSWNACSTARRLGRATASSDMPGRSGLHRRASTTTAPEPRSEAGRIGTVIWATGFRPDYGWLHVPALRPQRRPAPRRRNRRCAGALRARTQLHAPAQVELHPWRRRRRARPERPPGRVLAQHRGSKGDARHRLTAPRATCEPYRRALGLHDTRPSPAWTTIAGGKREPHRRCGRAQLRQAVHGCRARCYRALLRVVFRDPSRAARSTVPCARPFARPMPSRCDWPAGTRGCRSSGGWPL